VTATENLNTAESKPCHNGCIRKGTEALDQPKLMGALHGHFCDREFFAVKAALQQAAEVVEHVISIVGVNASSDDNVQSSREAPIPFNVGAFNDANEIYQRLVYWANHWADALRRQAPGAAKRAWKSQKGFIVGLPSDADPADARYAVSTMSIWLQAHLEDIMWQTPPDDVLYFHDEMADVFRVAARYPFKMKARFAKIPCPHDGSRIAVYPPTDAGTEMRIVCDRGHIYDEDRFEFYVREFGVIQDQKIKADATRARLEKKYVA
jgi:hypothetical protein